MFFRGLIQIFRRTSLTFSYVPQGQKVYALFIRPQGIQLVYSGVIRGLIQIFRRASLTFSYVPQGQKVYDFFMSPREFSLCIQVSFLRFHSNFPASSPNLFMSPREKKSRVRYVNEHSSFLASTRLSGLKCIHRPVFHSPKKWTQLNFAFTWVE